jgi:hypothetical protein
MPMLPPTKTLNPNKAPLCTTGTRPRSWVYTSMQLSPGAAIPILKWIDGLASPAEPLSGAPVDPLSAIFSPPNQTSYAAMAGPIT